MIPELGHFALLLALPVALVQGLLPLLGAWRGNRTWIAVARPAARASFLLIVVAFSCLVASFLRSDFSVLYVAENSNTMLPMVYKFGATWGGHEGSFLLWLLMLSGWTFAVSIFSRSLPDEMVARVLGVLGLIALGFLVTDTAKQVAVVYTGILPDLFAQGRGVVVQGTLGPHGTFHATQVLAKHSANYMPPEARDAIHDARRTQRTLEQ